MLIATASAGAQSVASGSFKGRRVSDVLNEFKGRGLNLIFSDALVPRSLRVTQEPRETTARGIVTEILAAHGLSIQEERRGALLVVKGGGRTAPEERPAPPEVSASGWIEGMVLDQATQRPVVSAVVLINATGAYAITGDDG